MPAGPQEFTLMHLAVAKSNYEIIEILIVIDPLNLGRKGFNVSGKRRGCPTQKIVTSITYQLKNDQKIRKSINLAIPPRFGGHRRRRLNFDQLN